MSLDESLQNAEQEELQQQEPVQDDQDVVPPEETVLDQEEEQEDEETQVTGAPSELELLRKRADLLGIRYRSNTGVEKLRSMIAAKLAEENPSAKAAAPSEGDTVTVEPKSKQQQIREARAKALELVRIRVTCQNPLKTEWESEIFTFGNSLVGTIKRLVPFETEWHVERALYEMIKERKYQHFFNKKDPNTGRQVRTSKLVPEFAIEVLPPLTVKELKELAQRQAMADGTQDA